MRRPCESCPWKKSTKTADIPGGGMQYTDLERLDRQMTAMGCHRDTDRAAVACSGFMAVVGFASLGVRLAAMLGADHPDRHCAGESELYDSFEEMLAAHHQGVE